MFQSPAQDRFDDELASNDNKPAKTKSRRQKENWRLAYQRKFSDFLFLIRSTKERLIVVHHPEVLGDDYDELVESLDRIADAGKRLAIMPRSERG